MPSKGAERVQLELRLIGKTYADGEIPLHELARIAEETQKLVRRMARALVRRSGPGRSAGPTEQPTQLLLVGLRPGSTILDIAGPPLTAELPFPGDVDPDTGIQALELLLDTAAALTDPLSPLPPAVDRHVAESVDAWLATLEMYDELRVSGSFPSGKRSAALSPRAGRDRVKTRPPPVHAADEPGAYAAEGVLYAVNLHTNRYHLQDDTGHTIPCVVEDARLEDTRVLLGKRVRVSGSVTRDEEGRIQRISVSDFEPASGVAGLDAGAFWKTTSREELLAGARPVTSIDDLVIEDLTPEEEAAFLKAFEE